MRYVYQRWVKGKMVETIIIEAVSRSDAVSKLSQQYKNGVFLYVRQY